MLSCKIIENMLIESDEEIKNYLLLKALFLVAYI